MLLCLSQTLYHSSSCLLAKRASSTTLPLQAANPAQLAVLSVLPRPLVQLAEWTTHLSQEPVF